MRWKEALGREVVDTSTAEAVGNVDGLVADPAAATIVALVVGDRVVSWTDAGGIGKDAVTLDSAELLREADSDLERGAHKGPGNPIKKQVITEDGFVVGTVADLEFDPTSGTIERLILSDGELAGSRLIGIGSFAVIVTSPDRV